MALGPTPTVVITIVLLTVCPAIRAVARRFSGLDPPTAFEFGCKRASPPAREGRADDPVRRVTS
jgi:hypothetical protein